VHQGGRRVLSIQPPEPKHTPSQRRKEKQRVGVGWQIRVRGEITGSSKCRLGGKSQSVLIMINHTIFTRTRRISRWDGVAAAGVCAVRTRVVFVAAPMHAARVAHPAPLLAAALGRAPHLHTEQLLEISPGL
jgi:hypothetical protein